jgi:hypothetical protein
MSADTRLPLTDLRNVLYSLRPSRLLLTELTIAAFVAVPSIVLAISLR